MSLLTAASPFRMAQPVFWQGILPVHVAVVHVIIVIFAMPLLGDNARLCLSTALPLVVLTTSLLTLFKCAPVRDFPFVSMNQIP
jgi:hypothetical protein